MLSNLSEFHGDGVAYLVVRDATSLTGHAPVRTLGMGPGEEGHTVGRISRLGPTGGRFERFELLRVPPAVVGESREPSDEAGVRVLGETRLDGLEEERGRASIAGHPRKAGTHESLTHVRVGAPHGEGRDVGGERESCDSG